MDNMKSKQTLFSNLEEFRVSREVLRGYTPAGKAPTSSEHFALCVLEASSGPEMLSWLGIVFIDTPSPLLPLCLSSLLSSFFQSARTLAQERLEVTHSD